MVAARVEEGYDAVAENDWIGLITSDAPEVDCSTDALIIACIDRIIKELKEARREIKPEYFLLKFTACQTITVFIN